MDRRKLLTTATIAALATPFLARADTLRPVLIQRTLDAPPRCVSLGDGKWTGFEIEASRLLCNKVGAILQPMQEHLVWARALRMIETGDIHLLPNVTWRPERAEVMDFIGPYAMVDVYILVRTENAGVRFETLDDFTVEGRIFDYVAGSVIEPAFDERLKVDPEFAAHFIVSVSSATLQDMGHVQALGHRVATGRVFGAIIDWYAYNAIQQMDPVDLPFDPAELSGIRPTLFQPETNYLTASLSVDSVLRQELHAAYRESRSDGSFDRIWSEWYPDREIPAIE